jgi:hypothetical protein
LKRLYSRNLSRYSRGIASTAPANSLPNFILWIVQNCWRWKLITLSYGIRGVAGCSLISILVHDLESNYNGREREGARRDDNTSVKWQRALKQLQRWWWKDENELVSVWSPRCCPV